ncbi:hypothetical protein QUB60_15020 [Microcoleus sp. A2-C5]|uniref:hypothetical protein n=1 Tax=Microcoleaceae TaxID=1892252 RepID=UPI0022375094|nr:hypothetical protein [Lyngbya sp. CCAP 1446/10]MCW6050548.1 hypothetical protein [Lyngbya sp. CCAP 1446/10]
MGHQASPAGDWHTQRLRYRFERTDTPIPADILSIARNHNPVQKYTQRPISPDLVRRLAQDTFSSID